MPGGYCRLLAGYSSLLVNKIPIPERGHLFSEALQALDAIAGDWLNWTARRHGGKVYVLTVNNGDGDGAVAIRAPGEFREARVLGESRSIPIRNGQFADQSEKLGVRHYVLE